MSSRCSQCPGNHRRIVPVGPTDAQMMVVCDPVGPWENKTFEGLSGRVGQEFNQTYLPLAGLERSEIYITPVQQCWVEKDGKEGRASDKLIECCGKNHLPEEVQQVRPEVVVLSGAAACSMLPAIDLEKQHGYPFRVQSFMNIEHPCWIVPMYSPGAGLKETRFMIQLLEDWEKLGKFFDDVWRPPTPENLEVNYELVDTPSGVTRSFDDLQGHQAYEYLAIDSESDEGNPYSIQYSPYVGKAYMLLVKDRDAIRTFSEAFRERYLGRAIFHHALHDLVEMDQMGISVSEHRDTMQELYHLGNLPQGLKNAVYRAFGFRMTSYDEVVTPHSKRVLGDWLAGAYGHASTEMTLVSYQQLKTKVKEIRKPHESVAVIKRIMTHLDGDYDPWVKPAVSKGVAKPRLIGRDWLPELERAVGRLPRKSIIHAPTDQQIQYACGDADWTGRLGTWLEKERERIVQEEWDV